MKKKAGKGFVLPSQALSWSGLRVFSQQSRQLTKCTPVYFVLKCKDNKDEIVL